MDYTMFLETLRLELTQKLGEGQTLMIRPVPRNNGVTLDGLSIRTPDSFLTPTVYLNPYYQQFKEGMSIEDIFCQTSSAKKSLPTLNPCSRGL